MSVVRASCLLGGPRGVLVRKTVIPYYSRWTTAPAFVQLDWEVRPVLPLILRLLYALPLPHAEQYDRQGVFLPQLAKEFPLAEPLTLADGRVVTSVLVPPFAYAGRGGRSRYIFPVDWLDFEPRLGFAWSPGDRKGSFAIRGGYGLSHVPLTGNNRLPNPDFGATQTVTATSGHTDPGFVLRIGGNPPLIDPLTPEQALNIPPDGLVYLGSINVPGFAV